MGLYEDLREIRERLERVLPPIPRTAGEDVDEEFHPGRDMVIEAEPVGVTRLNLDPKHWRLNLERIPARHTASRISRQWYARRYTQHGSTWADHEPGSVAAVPDGVRLWHASEEARQIMVHARHDLEELFEHGDRLPSADESTLLVTPLQTLGYRDGLALLTPGSPYLVRLCAEYARTACHLYGLKLREFATLTRMCVRRHVYPFTPISLQASGGGVYDSGPVLSVHVGTPQVAHEFSPILMPAGHLPVRVIVPEGVLVALDGHARASYGRGYAHAPGEGTVFYTLEFHMDCMRETRFTTWEPVTGALVMHTPVVSEHAVERSKKEVHGGRRMDTCVKQGVIRALRARLQDTESHLLSGKGHAAARRGENSPSSIMAE